MRALIFAGGDLSAETEIHISGTDLVICADRGYLHALSRGIVPDIIVGDFDSYSGELPEGVELHRSVPEKDDTDTLLAVRIAIDRGCGEIVLYGALGGSRFDHTVANVQTLIFIHSRGCKGYIADNCTLLTVQGAGKMKYPKRGGGYFSVFAMSDELHIRSLTGTKYPLGSYFMRPSFPIGVSNEIISDEAVLDIGSGLALVVYTGQ